MATNFWRGKKVLLTGHTGFKGCWLALALQKLGAHITGIALAPEGSPNLYSLTSPKIDNHIIDIRDREKFLPAVRSVKPEIVIHMAAQSLVLRSYKTPVDTFATNIMGSLYLLEALGENTSGTTILIVTSDKVYRNDDSGKNFRESDALGGDDPYSASKAAAEIAIHSWAKSFGGKIATARAGNVIGGGDFSQDRLLPDAYRAYAENRPLTIRSPESTRPWQHVLDVIFSYLKYIQLLHENYKNAPKALNIGPDGKNLSVKNALEIFEEAWGGKLAINISPDNKKPEKTKLKLDASLARNLGFKNALSQKQAIIQAAHWYKKFNEGESPLALTISEIENYMESHV